MTQQIHEGEPDTSEATVRALLSAELPEWADRPLAYLRTSGTDNAMWRVRGDVAPDMVVRLPRRPDSAHKVVAEAELLHMLAASELVSICAIPTVVHVGSPHNEFPHRWSVLSWLEGSDAWSSRSKLESGLGGLAVDLGSAVVAMQGLRRDLPAPFRVPGQRGGPIRPLVERIERWLDDPILHASELMDVTMVRALAREALSGDDPGETSFVHGDLIPGNLLVRSGRLSAILDWGAAGYGDPAQDMTPAWSVLDSGSRHRFREMTNADDATWIRARANALEQAVGGVLYYVPRRHPLGDVMTRTLDRILGDA